jgi:hypothetical protein
MAPPQQLPPVPMASPSSSKVAAAAPHRHPQNGSAILPPPKPTKTNSTVVAAPTGGLPPAYPRSSGAKRALPGTKKPRAKRSKQVDNRSTVTTTTDAARTPVNVYDAVLGECEDLLQAASEAQALGRLKMASAFQLLLHARLVGLGKRFDRATVIDDDPVVAASAPGTPVTPGEAAAPLSTTSSVASTPTSAATTGEASGTVASTPEKPAAAAASVQELSKYLPSHVELDSNMMEQLARVAMELHHQKTGRKNNSETQPMPPSSPAAEKQPNIAWTEQEKHQCQVLLDGGLPESEISRRMKSRTEAQVRAYLQNQKQRLKSVESVEQEMLPLENNNSNAETPRKKGRGRKPPTQAMNTVPNANLDAKTLLSGQPLGKC